ncbi:hypothetical protein BJY00DRAFT_12408 [Aspergillus carlsbadensis]|nr:hypothetical protein BJY00DRAFT_12408 [Aspergillus carlsbadensis]
MLAPGSFNAQLCTLAGQQKRNTIFTCFFVFVNLKPGEERHHIRLTRLLIKLQPPSLWRLLPSPKSQNLIAFVIHQVDRSNDMGHIQVIKRDRHSPSWRIPRRYSFSHATVAFPTIYTNSSIPGDNLGKVSYIPFLVFLLSPKAKARSLEKESQDNFEDP